MADLQLLHLVARTAAGARPFESRIACADLWERLGTSFDLAACVLMPDHLHLLAELPSRSAARSLARVLSAFRTRMKSVSRFEWEPLPRPEKVQRDKRHIARTVRYIHLNPVRDALCDDPIEWEWSTHRDWIGAVVRPFVDRVRWARAMGRPTATCGEWLHEYVSSDPSVRWPRPLADPAAFLEAGANDASIDALGSAVTRVLRSPRTSVSEFGAAERRLFLLSAARWTRYRAPELARHVGLHPTNVRKTIRRFANPALEREQEFVFGRRSGRARVPAGALSGQELRAIALMLAEPRLMEWPRVRKVA